MTLLILESFLALLLFLFMVWWTMFSGRPKGEMPADKVDPDKKLPPDELVKPPPP